MLLRGHLEEYREEMLRTAGLILTDEVTGKQGVTLAEI